MSQHADESIDQDPLYEFANESELIQPAVAAVPDSAQSAAKADVAAFAVLRDEVTASHAALNTRLDRLEHTHERTLGQFSVLRAELATLVASIEDIKRREVRRATYAARLPNEPTTAVGSRRTLPAVIGVVVGLAIAVLGWMTWQGGSIAVAGATPAQVATPEPVAPEVPAPVEEVAPAPAPPAITLASTEIVPPQRREVRTREVLEPHRTDTTYVGTLSIDSSPGGTVIINGKPAGHTPLLMNNLKAGSHLVWIERDGYRRFTRVVQVPADRVSRVFADLEPATP